jgi:hypothetical protein
MSEQAEPQSRTELVARVRADRARLEATLSRMSEEQLVQPGVEGDWSAKDIMAHIAAWEQRMVSWIDEALRGKIPAQPADDVELDRINAAIYEESQDRPLTEVLAEFETSYQVALAAAGTTPEADLMDPHRFAWRQGEPLWEMVASNTYWHYEEHGDPLRAWLEGQAGEE